MLRVTFVLRPVTVVLIVLAALLTPSYSQAQQASINIEIVSGGFIVGLAGGSGTLTYMGKRYPLRVGGVSIGATIGASKTRLIGQVYNLRRVSNIEGTYGATEVGYSAIRGKSAARLKNSKRVILQVRGRQVGLEVSADLSGMQISLR
jgi:hypothetical protein